MGLSIGARKRLVAAVKALPLLPPPERDPPPKGRDPPPPESNPPPALPPPLEPASTLAGITYC